MILHLIEGSTGPLVYVDAREDHLSPAAEPPAAEPAEQILYAVKGVSGADECIQVVSEEWGARIPMSPTEARKLAIKLIELAHKIEHPTTASEWP